MKIRYDNIPSKLFKKNRQRFMKKMPKGSIAVFFSNDLMPRSGDQMFPFRQNADIFYLTGIDQEETILILFPDAPKKELREILFLRKTDEYISIWEGHKYTKEQGKKTSDISNILWSSAFENQLHALLPHVQEVLINQNENDRYNSEVVYKDLRFAEHLRENHPGIKLGRSGLIMGELRSRKSDDEIKLMKRACAITRDAFIRVLNFVKPGVKEYEIEAEMIHEFLRQGSNGHAYEPIVASGGDSCILHYGDNNKECKKGDILLMDFGADYANYAADLTRTIPVNGKYSKRQKEVYNACLRIMREGIAMLKTGNILNDVNSEIGKIVTSELIGLKLLDKTDVKNQSKESPAYKKYFMHGLSHFIGIDVHDVGNRYGKIKPGMVFTCEPGIYIPKEKLGVRIENNILVTKQGQEDLMHDIPVEVEEIESLMN